MGREVCVCVVGGGGGGSRFYFSIFHSISGEM